MYQLNLYFISVAELKNTLKAIVNATSDIERTARFEKLQTVITWASIALDECDFGTGLELAIDLFCYGSQLLHKQALQMFTSSYTLLGRQEYIKIIQVCDWFFRKVVLSST